MQSFTDEYLGLELCSLIAQLEWQYFCSVIYVTNQHYTALHFKIKWIKKNLLLANMQLFKLKIEFNQRSHL